MSYAPHMFKAAYIEHSWSLSVEEHFYFIWPVVLLTMRPQHAWKAALGYVLVSPLIRYGLALLRQPALDIDFCSLSQMSSIAVGCFLAFVVHGAVAPKLQRTLQQYPLLWLLLGIVGLLTSTVINVRGWWIISDPVIAVAFALIMGALLYSQNKLLVALFNNQIMVMMGMLSYSLYLWQQPFFALKISLITQLPWSVKILGVFGMATLSYFFIEKPFLRYKDRLEQVRQ